MSRGLIAAALALALVAGVDATGAASATDPWTVYQERHPDLPEEDLLDVARGDDLARVLAILHNPDADFGPTRVRVRELGKGGGRELAAGELLAPEAAAVAGPVLVDLTQSCDAAAGAHGFTSWIFLREDRVAAWDLQSYGAGCRAEPRSFDALDHDAMREVGVALFRPAGRGPFRYGVLAYDEWNDAFAAPTRTATLSLLQQRADAAPRDARAQQHLAVGLQAASDRAGARRALERAAALDPSWRLPLENLLALYALAGDREAVSQIERRLAEPGVAAPPPQLAPRTPLP